MNRKELGIRVADMILSGMTRTEVFVYLTRQGIEDSQVASSIASYADPGRAMVNRIHTRIVVVIAFAQLAIAPLAGFGVGMRVSPLAGLLLAALNALIALLFIWGFSKNSAGLQRFSGAGPA
jgi:hypothetical protein